LNGLIDRETREKLEEQSKKYLERLEQVREERGKQKLHTQNRLLDVEFRIHHARSRHAKALAELINSVSYQNHKHDAKIQAHKIHEEKLEKVRNLII
jgi:hypothetical protein